MAEPQTHLPPSWSKRLRAVLQIPLSNETKRFFTAWQRAEGGDAKWNPLNTTLDLKGWTESDYNSTGVKNYKTGLAGIVATALTMMERNSDGTFVYPELLTDLRAGKYTAEEIVQRNHKDLSHWGTSPDLMLQVLKSVK